MHNTCFFTRFWYSEGVILYVIRRLLLMLPTALGVVTFTFLLMHLAPGDPIEVLLGEHALPADRASLRQALGLDLPLLTQYKNYLFGLLTGDWGTAYFGQETVLNLIGQRWPATAKLATAALAFALCVGIPMGVWAAANRKKWPDTFSNVFSLTGLAMPSFWLGPLLMIVFSLWLGILPVTGQETPLSIVLPAITLGLPVAAVLARLLRAQMLEILTEDFIRTAKAKGCHQQIILYRHALKNALLPVITVVFLQAGALLTGAILTEAVFAWPGLGSLLVESLQRRDYPVVQGCVLLIALVYVFATFLSDVVYAWADPRIKYQGQ